MLWRSRGGLYTSFPVGGVKRGLGVLLHSNGGVVGELPGWGANVVQDWCVLTRRVLDEFFDSRVQFSLELIWRSPFFGWGAYLPLP